MDNNHNLIITIINKGHAKLLMDAARAAGAKGGTILNGLGTGNQIEQLMGLNIPNEKEIVLIVSSLEDTAAIINAIKAKAGAASVAQGITFSLPVSDFAMLSQILGNETEN